MNDRAAAPGIDAVRRAMTADDAEPMPQPRPPAEVTRFAPPNMRRHPVEVAVAKAVNAALPPARPSIEQLTQEAAKLVSETILKSAEELATGMVAAAQAGVDEMQANLEITKATAEFIRAKAREDAARTAEAIARRRKIGAGIARVLEEYDIPMQKPVPECEAATDA